MIGGRGGNGGDVVTNGADGRARGGNGGPGGAALAPGAAGGDGGDGGSVVTFPLPPSTHATARINLINRLAPTTRTTGTRATVRRRINLLRSPPTFVQQPTRQVQPGIGVGNLRIRQQPRNSQLGRVPTFSSTQITQGFRTPPRAQATIQTFQTQVRGQPSFPTLLRQRRVNHQPTFPAILSQPTFQRFVQSPGARTRTVVRTQSTGSGTQTVTVIRQRQVGSKPVKTSVRTFLRPDNVDFDETPRMPGLEKLADSVLACLSEEEKCGATSCKLGCRCLRLSQPTCILIPGTTDAKTGC